MSRRSQSGGTMALVAGTTIVLVLIGVAFFFIAKIIGGEREMQHAGDSGNLNVAKQALIEPTVDLNSGVEADNFHYLTDPNHSSKVDLLYYNRMVGQALIVALNADQDGGPGGAGNPDSALSHAQGLINSLQGSASSLGGRLRSALKSTAGNPLFNEFGATANANSIRMLGNSAVVQHQNGMWDVAYMELGGLTNLTVPSNLTAIFGAKLSGITSVNPKDGQTYLQGYVTPALPASLKVAGVPVQPEDQPHLVSTSAFDGKRGDPVAGAFLPPNSFKSAAAANQEAGFTAGAVSTAIVGTMKTQGTYKGNFELAAKEGYIAVVNGPDPPSSGGYLYSGPTINTDNALAQELGVPDQGNGIRAFGSSGNPFTYNDGTQNGLVNQWVTYNQAYAANPATAGSPPSTSGFFNSDGSPASVNDCRNITSSNGVLCTDQNSVGAGSVSPCDTLEAQRSGPEPRSPFDVAFNHSGSYQSPPPGGGGMMAVECVKCNLHGQWNSDACATANGCPVTGLRKFARGAELPYTSGPLCKVSSEADAISLLNFVDPGNSGAVVNELIDHALMISPNHPNGTARTRAEVRSLLAGKTLNLGDVYFLHNDATSGDLVFDQTLPRGFKGWQADQTPRTLTSGQYNLVLTFVNPHHDFGIHDILYRDYPGGGVNGVDNAIWTPGSCYNNNCGKLQFTNTASGTACGFSKPD